MITICKDCIFAERNEEGIQNGCSFTNDNNISYLNIFNSNNEASINSGDNFYSINRMCRACTKQGLMQELPSDYKEVVQLRIKPTVDLIIFGEHSENIAALKNAQNKGYNQIYVCYPFQINSRQYFDLHSINNQTKVISQIDFTHNLCQIDSAVNKSDARYVVIQDSSKTIADNIISTVVNLEFNELKEFVCIVNEQDNLHGLVILTKAFKYFNGNKEKLVHQKIIEVNKDGEMILSWNQK